MLVKRLLRDISKCNELMISQYEELVESLPKGSLCIRKGKYYYLRYREGGKLYDKYVGKESETLEVLREKLCERRHYSLMLSKIKCEKAALDCMMENVG